MIAKSENIPTPAVRRLSLYLRQLETFHANDRRTVSSKQLGAALSLTDTQVRRDLAYFGQFGHAGVVYCVAELLHRVRRILGTDKVSKALLVGVGNLGRALLSFHGFARRGFEVVAAFDTDPAKIGMTVGAQRPIRVRPLSELHAAARAQSIRLGILVVPTSAAQPVADEMVAAGIKRILNFVPVRLQLGRGIAVSSVDLAVNLEQLSFQLNGLAMVQVQTG